nr:AfsR/SARP family transcriptional regulator [Streptomyces cacaoi]
MELRIQLFGAVSLQVGGEQIPLGTPKERLALAALAWDADRTVSVDTLVRRLWDDLTPAKPREALYPHISRIRKALSAHHHEGAAAVISTTHAYTLRADPDAVDLRRYLALLDQAREWADAAGDREALGALKTASSLWVGEPLAGLPGAWADHIRGVMEEKRLAVSLLQADITMRSGHYAEAVADLRPLAPLHTTKQSFAGRLALALHGSGRTDEAAALLQRTARQLRRTSGTEPGEELRRVHHGILAGTPARTLLPSPPMPSPRHHSVTVPPDTLPAEVPYVGREGELEQLADAADTREASALAAVITGMPGSGKSTLAVHAAHRMRDRFPDGQLFVNLRGHVPQQSPMTVTEVLRELLRVLDGAPTGLPQEPGELARRWRSAIRDRRIVAVLDDASSIDQVLPLLPGTSPALLLITSRRRLDALPGARHVALDVLPRTDSVAFLRRALKERAPTATQADTLARLCGDLPLALALATRRLLSRPAWGVADLIQRFEQAPARLPELRDSHHAAAQAFEVSYQALTPTQQRVFRLLGLHPGAEFGTAAVAALSGLPHHETELVLEELLACHLLSEPAPHRYRQHDLLREYASALAASSPAADNEAALGRLIRYYLRTADQADRCAYPHRLRMEPAAGTTGGRMWQRDEAQQWFTAEGPNLLAILERVRVHGAPHELAISAHVLAGFLNVEGYLNTAVPLLRTAAAHWEGTGQSKAHGRALIDLGTACAGAGKYDEAFHSAQKALHLSQNEDEELRAEALHQMSIIRWHTAQHAEALDLQQRALRIRLSTSDRLQQGRSFNVMGMLSLRLERHKDALKYFLEGRARFHDAEDSRGEFIALHNLAELYRESGDLDNAIGAYQRAIKISDPRSGGTAQYAILQMNLADTLRARGRPGDALALYGKALPAVHSSGDRRSEAIARTGIGRALDAMGDSERALPHHTAALAISRSIGAVLEQCQALRALGEAETATGRLPQARAHLEASLALSRQIAARTEEAMALRALSQAHHRGQQPPHPER